MPGTWHKRLAELARPAVLIPDDFAMRELTPAQADDLYELITERAGHSHAAVSTWLNAGVPAPQVAEWAGHSVDVLLRVYAKCITGQQADAKRRIEEATRPAKASR
jgi:hypothetical protein